MTSTTPSLSNEPVATRDGQYQGLDAITLQAADGARAVVTLHGGHVLSWVAAGGQEMLYLSPRSAFAPGQAIRGGVPVIFPQFSDRGPGKRHGFARVLPWRVVHEARVDGQALAVLRLTDSAQTRLAWDHGFELELALHVGGNQLRMALSCRNTGTVSFDFHAALHTYLRTDSIERTALQGLGSLAYQDNLDRQRKTQQTDPLRFDCELDRVYGGVAGELLLRVAHGAGECAVRIAQSGFEDAVVWNPGALKCAALADMPADGWREMVCVEAARVERPVLLQPGQSWVGEQLLTLCVA